MGLAGAPAEAVKPYEAKVEWLSWFQLSEESFVEPKAERLKLGLQAKAFELFFWLKSLSDNSIAFLYISLALNKPLGQVPPWRKPRQFLTFLCKKQPLTLQSKNRSSIVSYD